MSWQEDFNRSFLSRFLNSEAGRAFRILAGIAFLVELAFLKGRNQLKGHDVFALIKY